MYAELYYLIMIFLAIMFTWFMFVNYILTYPDRVGPKIDSTFDLSGFDVIGDFPQCMQKEQEQLYIFVSADCSQCKSILNEMQENYLKYQYYVTIVAVGDNADITEWKAKSGYNFPIICVSFETLKKEFNITIIPFAVKTSGLTIKGKSVFYEQYLVEKFGEID